MKKEIVKFPSDSNSEIENIIENVKKNIKIEIFEDNISIDEIIHQEENAQKKEVVNNTNNIEAPSITNNTISTANVTTVTTVSTANVASTSNIVLSLMNNNFNGTAGFPSTDKIDLAIKQLEQEIFTLSNMGPVDYVVEVCIKSAYRLAYVFYLKYRFLSIHQQENSQDWLEKAIEQSKIDNDHDLYMKSLLDQGELDYEKGKYVNAIKIWMQCLEYAVKLGNNEVAGHIVMNIGKVYFATNHYDLAKQYHKKAWDIAIKTDSQILKAGVCINLAVDCLELKQSDEAFNYIMEGEKYIDGLSEYSSLYSELMINLGRTKAQLGLYQEAIVILKFLYNFNISQDLKWQRILCEVNLGKVYFQNKDYEDASQWFETALNSASRMNASHMEMTIYKWLYSAYVEQQNYKLALKYYNNYIKTYEQLFKIEEKPTFNLFEEEVKSVIFKSQILLLNEEFNNPYEM